MASSLTSYEGLEVGLSVDGESVGELLGLRVGLVVGLTEGELAGTLLGEVVGCNIDDTLGMMHELSEELNHNIPNESQTISSSFHLPH